MAGTAKPNILNMGIEAQVEIINANGLDGQNGQGLFDGEYGDYNTNKSFYWYSTSNYLIIDVPNTVNIWRSGNSGYPSYNAKLRILKWNGTDYIIDVTDKYSIDCTLINYREWEMFVKNLPPGRYKFISNINLSKPYRMDSEWYVEYSKRYKYLLNDKSTSKPITIQNHALTLLKEKITTSKPYDTYGFEDISLLCNEFSKTSTSGNSIEIDIGKCFDIPILDGINSIESVVIR